jgi:phosphatidylserine/phosphatidylglycerophosphate/cardiolipin synthase-like enzyme
MNPFVRLPLSNLEALRSGFISGPLKYEITKSALIGSGAPVQEADDLADFLIARGYSNETLAAMVEAIIDTRRHATDVSLSQTLVVTGPATSHTENLKTGARFIQVVQHARRELMLATFALYQGDRILEPIHDAMIRIPGLEVTLILNVARKYGDRTCNENILEAARLEFSKNWPWSQMPSVWYFPESINMNSVDRASMHAKFVIADEERCFITSANFTEAAQKKNIEVGVELSNSHESRGLSRYFKQLMADGKLERLL